MIAIENVMAGMMAMQSKQQGQQTKKQRENYMENPVRIEEMYHIKDELGSGGFGKVKLAIHILTGERVAIKIIDKKAIGNDLPRVTSELEALKQLAHQNICRMFQFMETDEKYYIVMEYCNGGEMFDYIVRKDGLGESEARHFFRQLVQAVAYIHSMGFAHRDLKPENLLLTQDLQLKVIDFGLCAKPLCGLSRPLETCCGSPAYAAPELIQNHSYYGNEADIWSMGVLLYALLCGNLPFDDTNMPRLYRLITTGHYAEPQFLTPSCKEFLRSMLTVNPKERANIRQILDHPWLNKNYQQQLKWQTIYSREVIDEDVLRELAYFHGKGMDRMAERIKEWRFDELTATYLILLQKKERKQNFALPCHPHEANNQHQRLPCSPTIHASLDNDLDLSGEDTGSNSNASDDPLLLTNPMKMLTLQMPPPIFAHSPNSHHRRQPPPTATINGLVGPRIPSAQPRPTSVYTTPRRGGVPVTPVYGGTALMSPLLYRRPNSAERPPRICVTPTTSQNGAQKAASIRSNSTEKAPIKNSSVSPPSLGGTPTGERVARRDGAKSPSRLRQRVFSSLERKADRMINLLTPKKIRTDAPTKLKCIKTMVNVSVTSSTNAAQVRDELWKVLHNQGLETTQNGWKICGSKKNPATGAATTVELEVVMIERLPYVGVRRKRIQGDAFMYKRICEEVLRLAGL